MTKRVYVVALNAIPFLPYVHGLLRGAVERDEALRGAYEFGEPLFLLDSMAGYVARLREPSVVGFSCYVWNFRRQMALARELRSRHPDVLIVAGGPHVPDTPGQFLEDHPYLDVLVHGEGEPAFRELLTRYLHCARPADCDFQGVAATTVRTAAGPVTTPRRSAVDREIDQPSAYTTGYLDAAIEECRRHDRRFYAPWETNRGCPFSCAFCDWGSSTMSRVRRFPDAQLEADIEYFAERRIPNVFICDANFGLLPRDVELARLIGTRHAVTGFPQQVRVNFAKNSNERVFAISSEFERHSMLMGTTLSLQSTSMEVLEAIDRENIGLKQFQDLHTRYRRAGIHTYTELILGLPRETRRSFYDGLGALFEAGNHQDVRVFDFMLLPNAPINTAEARRRHALDTIIRPLYVDPPGTPPDQVERGEFVVGTSTLSRTEWRECAVHAQLLQILHVGCVTRYLAIHLRRQYGLPYTAFYERLSEWAAGEPATVLGGVIAGLSQMYQRYLDDPTVPQVNLVASQPALVARLARYGHRRGWTPDHWGWLCIADDKDRFDAELRRWAKALPLPYGAELDDVLRYQSDIIISESYDPRAGKRRRYRYDFPAYFAGDAPLRERPTLVHFRDVSMGVNRQYALCADDPLRFAKAALGESYPFVRIRHYQHQLDCAAIQHDAAAFAAGGDDERSGAAAAVARAVPA